MNDIIEKMRSDKKYKAKIELMIYGAFFLIAVIYALIVNNNNSNIETLYNNYDENQENEINNTKTTDTIEIPNEYSYIITINKNDEKYKYSGQKTTTEKTIIKEKDDKVHEYLYKDNDYYELANGIYIKVNEEEIYDVIDYRYIDLKNINNYLLDAKQNGNDYIINLSNIVLNNNSDEKITININNNIINIDYTPLLKLTESDIEKYLVTISLEEIE